MFDLLQQACKMASAQGCQFADARYPDIRKQRIMSRDHALSGSSDSDDRGFTGMTRDGTYRIENGKITYPVVDMRWNDSVLRVLNNVRASGRPTATGEFFAMVMPALKIEDFNFSSLSN